MYKRETDRRTFKALDLNLQIQIDRQVDKQIER
jgi:hypothetical protein